MISALYDYETFEYLYTYRMTDPIFLNKTSNNGATLLMYAINSRNPKIVEIVLNDHRIKNNTKIDDDGMTPMCKLISNCNRYVDEDDEENDFRHYSDDNDNTKEIMRILLNDKRVNNYIDKDVTGMNSIDYGKKIIAAGERQLEKMRISADERYDIWFIRDHNLLSQDLKDFIKLLEEYQASNPLKRKALEAPISPPWKKQDKEPSY
jgi:hypothetical protein